MRMGIVFVFAATVLGATQAHASLDLKKKWYLGRARSNMEIRNYAAAIEAYEKVLEEEPDNTEAMKNLGTAYEAQGLKDKAVAQYDRYLAKNPEDSAIAFKQAETLGWSRYNYRKDDALEYYRMGLRRKNDTRMRLRYARLLASSKDSTPEAIEQYRTVLKSNPSNWEAHQGLAKAYAWQGENDKAVHHASLAREHGGSSAELHRLDSDLGKGREPELGGEFLFLTQPGSGYELNGFRLGSRGRHDIGAFVTARAQAGFENYWQADNRSASGGYFNLGADYRVDLSQTLTVTLGYHSLDPIASTGARSTGANGGAWVGGARYRFEGTGYELTPGFERTLRGDSLLALAGDRTLVRTGLGAARSNAFFVEYVRQGDSIGLRAKPYFGWVSSLTSGANVMLGADATAELKVIEGGEFELNAAHLVQLAHYGEDRSALSGAGDGYFSPQFFTNQHPHLRAKLALGDTQELNLSGGPSFQYVRDTTLDGAWQVGANVGASYGHRFTSRLQWRSGASFMNVSDKFNRLQFENALTYVF